MNQLLFERAFAPRRRVGHKEVVPTSIGGPELCRAAVTAFHRSQTEPLRSEAAENVGLSPVSVAAVLRGSEVSSRNASLRRRARQQLPGADVVGGTEDARAAVRAAAVTPMAPGGKLKPRPLRLSGQVLTDTGTMDRVEFDEAKRTKRSAATILWRGGRMIVAKKRKKYVGGSVLHPSYTVRSQGVS
jgi:hypothetical protein